MAYPSVRFDHPQLGTLINDNGLDMTQWAYGLNTATFPTFGGEVVQILSVYIDNLTIQGTVSTYEQMEQIYHYFSRYLQVATQGATAAQAANNNGATDVGSYNLQPITMTYASRGWVFDLMPIELPGFHLGVDVIGPQWSVSCFVVDTSPDMGAITNGIQALVTAKTIQEGGAGLTASANQLNSVGGSINGSGATAQTSGIATIDPNSFGLTGNISPASGDPNTNPFQTDDETATQAEATVKTYASYYNSLIPSYEAHDFATVTGQIGSSPNLGQTSGGTKKQKKNSVTQKVKPRKHVGP